jgi:hypothetical protein
MKIANYEIQQKSAHKLVKSSEVSEKLEFWTGKAPQDTSRQDESAFLIDFGSSKKLYQYSADKMHLHTKESAQDESQKDTTDVKLKLIESFIYMTTGKRVKLRNPELNAKKTDSPVIADPAAVTVEMNSRDNWGLIYEYHEVRAEEESIYFNSAGTVNTTDGRTISFDLDFSMNRSFFERHDVSLRMGDAAKMDPLIISLNNQTPQLTQNKFEFDLNADGKDENISFAAEGSGFLAYDKNDDGMINDGTELFGPETGDGFMELRAYDMDSNGWIDESDDIFSRLSIYSMSENGDKALFKLGDAGIGAIYLNDTATPFEFKDATGVSAGALGSTSIFLRENGTAGTIHHVDLTI